MAGGSTQQSLRKALGAIKDSTKVGLAKVNSDYKVRYFPCVLALGFRLPVVFREDGVLMWLRFRRKLYVLIVYVWGNFLLVCPL